MHSFRRKRFETDESRRVFGSLAQDQFSSAAIRTEPGLTRILVRDMETKDFRCIPNDGSRIDNVNLDMPNRMYEKRHCCSSKNSVPIFSERLTEVGNGHNNFRYFLSFRNNVRRHGMVLHAEWE
jgi:hypothetical protein